MTRRRVFLHVGLTKTGTTYLQGALRANADALRDGGVLYAGSRGLPPQSLAVWDLQGRRARGVDDHRVAGQWRALVDAILASDLRACLLSEESLGRSTLRQARLAAGSFEGCDVDVIVTVRDLARVAVSSWQQQVKSDRTWTWSDFAAGIRDPAGVAEDPGRGFWMSHDVVRICEVWEAAVGAARVHVVTVPRPGAPRDLLLRRVGSVVGFDADLFTREPPWSNETVGVAGVEVIRRLNERLGSSLNQRQYHHVVQSALTRALARAGGSAIAVPEDELGWLEKRADELITGLRDRGYPIVGDLEELRPEPATSGREPDDVEDPELLDAAMEALTVAVRGYAEHWWAGRRDSDVDAPVTDLKSGARSVGFSARRRAAALADRSAVARRAVLLVLRSRERRRLRVLRRSRG